MILRPTSIKKNPELKNDPKEESLSYNNYMDVIQKINSDFQMDMDTVHKLIEDINKLDVEDHMKIYIFLRNNDVDRNFFSKNKRATHFDLLKLPNQVKWKLYKHVKMLTDNNQRSQLISSATAEYEAHINRLDQNITAKHQHRSDKIQLRPQPQLESESENARYEKMLRLNES